MLNPDNDRFWTARGRYLSATAAMALAATIGMVELKPASAFTCDSVTNPAGGNSGANDNGDAENTACGTNAEAAGGKATAYGLEADALASESVAVGANAQVDADSIQGIAIGRNAHVFNSATGGVAIGRNSQSSNAFAVSLGESANASGNRSVAIGKSAQATGDFSTAIGNSANTNGFAASTAIGVGAQASAANQMVFGRASETYTMPGITSDLSKSRQSGPLEVLTSDANGNLASDGGSIFSELDQLNRTDKQFRKDIDTVEGGVAVALSAVGPDLAGVERFGLSLNWGGFEGASAIGGGATAVVSRWNSSRLAVTGGVGVALDEEAVGGRVGGQWTW